MANSILAKLGFSVDKHSVTGAVGVINSIGKAVSGLQTKMKQAFALAGVQSFATGIKSLGASIKDTFAKSFTMAQEFAATGDKIAKTSRMVGLSVKDYQAFASAAQHAGMSTEEMDSALTVFGDVYIDDNCDLTVEGTIYCSNGVQNSDERIKENIVNVDANIEDIASTRIVTFNFKDKEERNLGTIAQDWQKIFPEAVKENKDGMLALDYSAISIASAVKAAREIVELKKKNEELEARLAALEAKLG